MLLKPLCAARESWVCPDKGEKERDLAESHRPRLLTTRRREKRAHSCFPPRLPSDPALTKHRRGTELLVLPAFLSFLTPALLKEKSIA